MVGAEGFEPDLAPCYDGRKLAGCGLSFRKRRIKTLQIEGH